MADTNPDAMAAGAAAGAAAGDAATTVDGKKVAAAPKPAVKFFALFRYADTLDKLLCVALVSRGSCVVGGGCCALAVGRVR